VIAYTGFPSILIREGWAFAGEEILTVSIWANMVGAVCFSKESLSVAFWRSGKSSIAWYRSDDDIENTIFDDAPVLMVKSCF
jgi:hypothetical protein